VWALHDRDAGCGVEIAPEMGANLLCRKP
jgi:hypothetical protein